MLRALRNLYKEFTSFGKPELEMLREQTKQLQEQLIQLKAARAERERQQEVLAIAKLRVTVEQMKQMDAVTHAAEKQVKNLVEDLGESARPRMQAAIAAEVQEKAEAALKQLDMDDLFSDSSANSAAQPKGAGAAELEMAPHEGALSPVADTPPAGRVTQAESGGAQPGGTGSPGGGKAGSSGSGAPPGRSADRGALGEQKT